MVAGWFLSKKLAFKDPPSLKFHDRTDINCIGVVKWQSLLFWKMSSLVRHQLLLNCIIKIFFKVLGNIIQSMDVTQPFNVIAIDMGRIFLTSYAKVYCIVQVLCSLEMIWEISRAITVLNLGTLSTHILSNKTFANVVFYIVFLACSWKTNKKVLY